MGWMPNLPTMMVNIKQLENGKDNMVHSARLFWLFFNSILPPDKFRKNLLRDDQLRIEGTIEIIDPEIERLVIRGSNNSEVVLHYLEKRFTDFMKKIKTSLSSSKKEDIESLFVLIHLGSADLVRMIKNEGFSENTKTKLNTILNAFLRCESILRTEQNTSWPKYFIASLRSVGSILWIEQYSTQKADSQYENALKSFLNAIYLIPQSRLMTMMEAVSVRKDKTGQNDEIPERERLIFDLKLAVYKYSEKPSFSFTGAVTPDTQSWVNILTQQSAADCFDALRKGGRIVDRKSLTSVCRRLIEVTRDNPLGTWNKTDVIKDSEGCIWEPVVYWNNTLGWLEAQLNSTDLLEVLHEKEDEDAEKRLRTYFFDDGLWELIPERAQKALVNADRDWFSEANARIEAVLNEIRVASEELLFQGLWLRLNQWMRCTEDRRMKGNDFEILHTSLKIKEKSPGLLSFENMLKYPITEEYLKSRKTSSNDLDWILNELPRELTKLRRARGKSEHESKKWTRDQLNTFFDIYMGLGQPGVLPRLARILFYKPER